MCRSQEFIAYHEQDKSDMEGIGYLYLGLHLVSATNAARLCNVSWLYPRIGTLDHPHGD